MKALPFGIPKFMVSSTASMPAYAAQYIIPTKGWSALSVEGTDLYEPETDAVFAPALREHLRPDIEVRELDTHLNTPEFAKAAVEALEAMKSK